MSTRLLIVDDDEEIRTQFKWALASDYEILLAEDRASALRQCRAHQPPVVMLDLGLPPNPNLPDEGLAALGEILAAQPSTKVIIISGQNDKQNALHAVGAGAYDFLSKPVDLDVLRLLLQRCFYLARLEEENRALQEARGIQSFEGMLGNSAPMQAVFAFIRKVAAASAPVLLLGESGTGKEMAALAIHQRSPRKDLPFVAVNCNAIPENLLESELFGHEKGAFTGAHTQRIGLIESASRGTLFLDEIGELPLAVQVKLLRYLQEKTFQRVGGRQELRSDARIIAATNADLKQAIAGGTFREDLYFRLAVVVIKLPPLRDRADDIPLIAREFLQRYAVENARTGLTFTPDAMRAMQTHSWSGNVRELQNRVQRAVIMADGKRISVQDMELAGASEGGTVPTLKDARETVEREMVVQALKRHSNKITAAASELGVSRPTFYELMEKLGVAKP